MSIRRRVVVPVYWYIGIGNMWVLAVVITCCSTYVEIEIGGNKNNNNNGISFDDNIIVVFRLT